VGVGEEAEAVKEVKEAKEAKEKSPTEKGCTQRIT
jgi:hypothetical protein